MCIFVLLLLVAGPAFGQVNIEHYRGRMGVTGSASYSFDSDLGNVDVLNSGGAGNITINRAHGTVLAIFKGGIGIQGGKRFANNGVVHVRYTHKKNRRYQPEGFIQSDYATSRQLDWRTLVGAGLRFNARDSETVALSFGGALMWEREGLDLAPGDPHPAIHGAFEHLREPAPVRASVVLYDVIRTGSGRRSGGCALARHRPTDDAPPRTGEPDDVGQFPHRLGTASGREGIGRENLDQFRPEILTAGVSATMIRYGARAIETG